MRLHGQSPVPRTTAAATLAALALLVASTGWAGGALETVKLTGNPTPIPGHQEALVIGIRWDPRCDVIRYSMNTTLDPVPNPLGAPFLSVAAASAAFQDSFDAWNDLTTSYIDMQVTGTTANAGLAGFDMVNELTFRTSAGFGAIASSPSTSFIVDVNLVHGDDIDGDGDADVSAAIATCQDVDSDGDVEFPAGSYPAGTILDNDVQYNTKASNGFRFTVNPADVDTVTRSVDLLTVAVHEFGHSHGLSHTLSNQISGTDGTSAVMFPFIDTGDPASELAGRVLDTDDAAWSSFFYPEGSAASGPGALGPGDVAFGSVFGLIQGNVHHGVFDEPVAGAHVIARNRTTGEVMSTGFSGTTRLSRSATGGLFLVSPDWNILDGAYTIPVPRGKYDVLVEAVDGLPAASGNISLTCQIGDIFGQQNFREEAWNGAEEAAVEAKPSQATPVVVNASGSSSTGIGLVTNRQTALANFGNRNFVGFTGSGPGFLYAVRVPGSQIAAVTGGAEFLVHAAEFQTFVTDASVVPVWAKAVLTTGQDNGDGTATVDLASPLEVASGFVGQDNDFAPFYFFNPDSLGQAVKSGLDGGTIDSLFLVLEVPAGPFPGVSAAPPFIGLDGGVVPNDVPIHGLSFTSSDGGATFVQSTTFNFMFSLVLSEKP